MTTGAAPLAGVSETSLIPLYFRAMESREADPMIMDRAAVDVVDRLGYDFSDIDAEGPDRVFAMMRARQFDRYTRAFVANHPTRLSWIWDAVSIRA